MTVGSMSRRPEFAMRFSNAADRIDCWVVVEQCAAAAIHLHVNETRHQQAAS